MSSVEFQERNKTIPNLATWIFDATEVPVFVYNNFRMNDRQVYFCGDEFRETCGTDSGNVTRQIRNMCCRLRQCDTPD